MEDALLLARAQFGLNIGVPHPVPDASPSRSAGCCCASARATSARGDPAWLATYKLWVKVFALTFAMGVVTGVTM